MSALAWIIMIIMIFGELGWFIWLASVAAKEK